MQLTVKEIVNANEALKSIAGKEFPSILSYNLSRLELKLSPIAQSFEKVRSELVKKYGTEKEDKRIYVTEENTADFYMEFNKVADAEESIDFTPMPLKWFEGFSFSKEFYIAMDKFIDHNHGAANPNPSLDTVNPDNPNTPPVKG